MLFKSTYSKQFFILLLLFFLFTFCDSKKSNETTSDLIKPKRIIKYPDSLFFNIYKIDLKNANDIFYFNDIYYTIETKDSFKKELLYKEFLFDFNKYTFDYKGSINYIKQGVLYGLSNESNYYKIEVFKNLQNYFKRYEVISDSCYVDNDTLYVLNQAKFDKFSLYKNCVYELKKDSVFNFAKHLNSICKKNNYKIIQTDTFRKISYNEMDKFGETNYSINNVKNYKDIRNVGNVILSGYSKYSLLYKEFLSGTHYYSYYDTLNEKWNEINSFAAHNFYIEDEKLIVNDFGCCGAIPKVEILNYKTKDTLLRAPMYKYLTFKDVSDKKKIIGYFGIYEDDEIDNKLLFISSSNKSLIKLKLNDYNFDKLFLIASNGFKIDLLEKYQQDINSIDIDLNQKYKLSMLNKSKQVFSRDVLFK